MAPCAFRQTDHPVVTNEDGWMSRFFLFSIVFVLLSPIAANATDQWPRFRGVRGDGVGDDHAKLPLTWNDSKNVRWVVDIPGWGWSSPIVWGNRVFLTTVVSDEANLTPSKGLYLGEGVRDPAKGVHHWLVTCFDLNTGKELWTHEAHRGQPQVPRHPKSTYAAETAVTDGERLYVLFGDVGLYCYDLDGKLLWSNPIEPKKTFMDYGAAASPVVHDGQVILVYDNLEDSWIASFDAETGEERWKRERDETHSWATPLVWSHDQRTEIVVPGKRRNRSYSLSGEVLWEFDGQMSNLVIPSPLVAHGMCYIASGYVGDAHRPTFAILPGGEGDLAKDEEFAENDYIHWYQGTSSSYNPSQTIYGDYLYTLYDQGFLTCHHAKTGEQVYGKKRFSPKGSFTASPFAYNDHLFCLSEDGLTYVLKAGPDFEIVERNDLDELCIACPAIVDDKLLIRTASRLYCLTDGYAVDPAVSAGMEPRRSAEKHSDIWSAAASGDDDEIVKLLGKGISVDARQGGRGATPLRNAILYGHPATVRLLLEEGADTNDTVSDGNSLLHVAAFFADQESVEALIAAGADLQATNRNGETPLDIVAGEWTPQVETLYRTVGNMLGRDFDLEALKRVRPRVAEKLRQAADGRPEPNE